MEKNFDFDDVDDEELDFVQPREKIPVKLHITAINKHNESEDKENCDQKRSYGKFI